MYVGKLENARKPRGLGNSLRSTDSPTVVKAACQRKALEKPTETAEPVSMSLWAAQMKVLI